MSHPSIQTKARLASLAGSIEGSASDQDELAAGLQQSQAEFPADLSDFLGRLMLLYGLPLDYLIPAARMLPPHSWRSFAVDINWLYALIDGALSTGVHSGRDIELQRLLAPLVRQASTQAAAEMRAKFRDFTAETFEADSQTTWSGFFLRSPLVSGWPGLEIIANDQNGAKLPLLRLERLAPDILFALYQGSPAEIILREPAEGLHFGLSDEALPLISVRDPLTGAIMNEDSPISDPPPEEQKVPWRNDTAGTDGVLDIGRLKERVEHALPVDTIGAGGFALQMIETAQRIIINLDRAAEVN